MDELKAFAAGGRHRGPPVARARTTALAARGRCRPGGRRGGHQPDHLRAPARIRRRHRRAPRQGAGDYGEGFAQPRRRPRAAPAARWSRRWAASSSTIRATSVFVALVNRLDLFLHAYVAMNAAHAARALPGYRCASWGRERMSEGHHRRRRPRPPPGQRDRRDPEVHGQGRRARRSCTGSSTRWRAAGVDDVVIVRGYLRRPHRRGRRRDRLRFVENPDWASNNILASLLYAAAEMHDGFLFSYSDIVFPPRARPSRRPPRTAPVALVVDRRWRDAYVGRTLHPVSEAELARVDGRRRRRRASPAWASSWSPPRRPPASSSAWPVSRRRARRRCARSGRDALARRPGEPFGAAATLRQAYLTDGLNAMADARRPRWRRCSSTAAGARSTPSRIWPRAERSSTPGGA